MTPLFLVLTGTGIDFVFYILCKRYGTCLTCWWVWTVSTGCTPTHSPRPSPPLFLGLHSSVLPCVPSPASIPHSSPPPPPSSPPPISIFYPHSSLFPCIPPSLHLSLSSFPPLIYLFKFFKTSFQRYIMEARPMASKLSPLASQPGVSWFDHLPSCSTVQCTVMYCSLYISMTVIAE